MPVNNAEETWMKQALYALADHFDMEFRITKNDLTVWGAKDRRVKVKGLMGLTMELGLEVCSGYVDKKGRHVGALMGVSGDLYLYANIDMGSRRIRIGLIDASKISGDGDGVMNLMSLFEDNKVRSHPEAKKLLGDARIQTWSRKIDGQDDWYEPFKGHKPIADTTSTEAGAG